MSFLEIFRDFRIIITLFLSTLNKSVLIEFQNDHIFKYNGFINFHKMYQDTFLSKKWGYKKVLFSWFFKLPCSQYKSVQDYLNSNLHSRNTIFSWKKMIKKGYYGKFRFSMELGESLSGRSIYKYWLLSLKLFSYNRNCSYDK